MRAWATSIPEAKTVPELFAARCKASPQDLAYRFHVGRGWRDVTWSGLRDRVQELGAGLLSLDLLAGERVGVIGETRPEWGITDLAALACGGVTVGLYQTSTPEQWAHVLDNAQVSVLFVDHGERLAGVRLVRARLPRLRWVIVWDAPDGLDEAQGELSLYELTRRGRQAGPEAVAEVWARAQAVDPLGAANLVYTSGTTGPPKGAIITHRNVLAMLLGELGASRFVPGDVTISFLPMCHVAEKVVSFYGRMVFNVGTAYARSLDFRLFLEDLREVRPTVFGSVPRIFEKVYARARMRAQERGAVGAAVFERAVRVAVRWSRAQRGMEPASAWLRAQHRLMDRLVYQKVRELFGGRVRFFLSGAAPISLEILEFFHGAGMMIYEVYGLTESSAVATANREGAFRFGTVGRPVNGVEVRLAEDGEVLLRGATVFAGYFRDEAATREMVDGDGWLHTGDVGAWDEAGYLKIVDRKKNIIISAGGKNIAPQGIENLVKEDPFISQCVLIGDRRPYLVALLTLDNDEAAKLAERLGIRVRDLESLSQDPAVLGYVGQVVDKVNGQLGRVEQIRRFRLLPRDLSLEAGEMTPTLKVRRQVVERTYAALIEELYAQGD
jgi:long-chain acyl-CoA synthetase